MNRKNEYRRKGILMPQVKRFSYGDYMIKLRDWKIVEDHLRGFIPYFKNCKHVVDVGTGEGAFLRLLQDAGIKATGIENDALMVEELHRRGLSAVAGDAAAVWQELDFEFDGLFCSHLIEHLPFEVVVDLVEGMACKMQEGGIAVFAFPNPESIEMQLFHFWRDPQHVRFYHPDLMGGMLEHYGFEVVRSFSQGKWGQWEQEQAEKQKVTDVFAVPQATTSSSSVQPSQSLVRKIGRKVKNILGIPVLEVEADYMKKLRDVGREAVVIGRKK